jgi:1-acyl-sn-glycerol-3-phosphate acyltransferase
MLGHLYRSVCHLRIDGLHHVPASGGCLLVFNHLSNFDPHLIYSVIPRTDLTGLLAENYRKRPFHRFMIESFGGIWLRRGSGDREALKTALDLLGNGWMVGIAPEGRRSPTGALAEAKRGASFLATRANVPVLPVGITGTEKMHRAIPRLLRADVTVTLGEPFMLNRPSGRNQKQQLQEATDQMMGRIAALLPAAYRGVYAHHASAAEIPHEHASS